MKRFALLASVALALTGCTTAQIASTEATVSKYQADVAAACSIAEAALTNPLATAAMAVVPEVAQAANLVKASCGTEAAIASLVASPLSVAWLGTLSTTLNTGGKTVLPAPVAPT